MRTLKRYLSDGSTRAVWDDAQGPRERKQGVFPQRASRIEVIMEGPKRGQFHVDFTLLAECTGKQEYCVCLVQTYHDYGAANRAEVEWLTQHWVLKPEEPCVLASSTSQTSAVTPTDN
jgi:hypothetical protein